MNGIVAAVQGFAGQDGEARYTQNGKLFLTFSVGAVVGKPPPGEEKGPVEWVRVTCWDETAAQLRTRIVKGTEVYVEGKLTLGRWEASDGTPRSGLNLSAWTVQTIGQVGRRVPREARQAASSAANARAVDRAMAMEFEEDLDSLPF